MTTEPLSRIRSWIISHRPAAFLISAILHAAVIVTAWSLARERPGAMEVFEVSLMDRPPAEQRKSAPPGPLPDLEKPPPSVSAPPPAILSEQPVRAEVPEKRPAPEAVDQDAGGVDGSAAPVQDAVNPLPEGGAQAGPRAEALNGQGEGGGGTGEGGQGAVSAAAKADLLAYQSAVRARIEAVKVYPISARWRHTEGTVVVKFRLNHAGKLLTADIIRSSGHAILDQAAMTTLRRGEPYPTFHSEEDEAPPTMTVDISFVLD